MMKEKRCTIINKRRREYYKENKEAILKQCREYQRENKEAISEQRKGYYQRNREAILKRCKEYQKTEKGKEAHRRGSKKHKQTEKGKLTTRKSDKKRRDKNKIACNMSCMMWKALKGNKNGRHWEDLIGYTKEQLEAHFISLFKDGMTLDNNGLWHNHHIRPIRTFNITSYDCKDFKECFGLSNLLPVWIEDHRKIHSGDKKVLKEYNILDSLKYF